MEKTQTMKPNENVMGTMPCNRLLIRISLPIMISMLVQALYNVVDSVFVAKLGDAALNAVSLAFPVQNLMIAIAVGTGVGVNAVLSKSLGAHRFDRANAVAGNSIVLALISSIVLVVFGIFGSKPYFTMQTDVAEVVEMGSDYIMLVSVCSFGVFLQIAFERMLQATGKTMLSMIMQLSGAITNIALDPILIFGKLGAPQMGVKGAAVATVIGQCVATAVGLILNLTCNKEIKLSLKSLILKGDIVKRIYVIGVPAILMSSIGSVMVLGMNAILLRFNTETGLLGMVATNVFGVYFKLQSFVFMPVFGLTNGMIPIVAYNFGARKRDRIVKTIKLSMIYAVAMMLIGLLIMQLLPEQLMKIFDKEGDMTIVGVRALRIISISFLFAGFNIVCSSAYQALGNSVYSLIVSVARQLVIVLPAAYLLSLTGDVNAVWWSLPLAEIVCVALCVLFLNKTIKKLNRTVSRTALVDRGIVFGSNADGTDEIVEVRASDRCDDDAPETVADAPSDR